MKFTIKREDNSNKTESTKKIKVQKTISKVYNKENIYTKIYNKAGKAIFDFAGKFSKKKS